jgi:hypothetical protein
MNGKVPLVCTPQPLQRRRMIYAEGLSSDFTEFGADNHGIIVAETDQACVERLAS